jgi:hypothetical protein
VHGARQSIAGKGLRGTPGACYTRVILGLPLFRRPPAAKKRLVYMVRLARNLTSECLGSLPSNAG